MRNVDRIAYDVSVTLIGFAFVAARIYVRYVFNRGSLRSTVRAYVLSDVFMALSWVCAACAAGLDISTQVFKMQKIGDKDPFNGPAKDPTKNLVWIVMNQKLYIQWLELNFKVNLCSFSHGQRCAFCCGDGMAGFERDGGIREGCVLMEDYISFRLECIFDFTHIVGGSLFRKGKLPAVLLDHRTLAQSAYLPPLDWRDCCHCHQLYRNNGVASIHLFPPTQKLVRTALKCSISCPLTCPLQDRI